MSFSNFTPFNDSYQLNNNFSHNPYYNPSANNQQGAAGKKEKTVTELTQLSASKEQLMLMNGSLTTNLSSNQNQYQGQYDLNNNYSESSRLNFPMHMRIRNYRNNITNDSNRLFSPSKMPITAFYEQENAEMYDHLEDNLFYKYTD